jgi:hypothetical protein
MVSRRRFIAAGAAGIAGFGLGGCSGEADMQAYRDAAARLRAALVQDPALAELVRCATLAPNGHNTQPWRFAPGTESVRILPDFTRRTPVVDPDDHHLYVSLGCAAENLALAARRHGRDCALLPRSDGDGTTIDCMLDATRHSPADARDRTLFAAIPLRQSTRSVYDGSPVSAADLAQLADAARIEGVELILITEPAKREAVLAQVIAGNSAQMDDPAFIEELRQWIRFDAASALQLRDGLFAACSGNPVLPDWLGRRMFGLVFRKPSENDKYAAQVRSSAGIAVFVGARADHEHWIRVGRSFQRFALQGTSMGLRHAHINQPVEVPAIRGEFARWLGVGERRPDLVIRFGRAPELPMSMRRSVAAVLAAA